MKRLYTLAVCLVALIVSAVPAVNIAQVTFSFNYDFVGNPDLANFFVYYGTASSNYTTKINIGLSTNYTIGLPRNVQFFGNVTAASTNGLESDYTTEVAFKTLNKPKPAAFFKATQ